jgi:hypothetical protein
MFGQPLVDVLFDAAVRSPETARSAAGVWAAVHGVIQTFPPTAASKVSVTLNPIFIVFRLVRFRHRNHLL